MIDASRISPTVVDRDTVERLELFAPSISRKDKELVERLIESREIFEKVSHEEVRENILGTLEEIEDMIPSLRSFFESLKFLEPCCNILKKLLRTKEKRTLYQSFSATYFEPSEQMVEYRERKKRTTIRENLAYGLWLSYVQLWAFCLRHFPPMTQIPPRKEPGKEKPSIQSSAALWHHLAILAVDLGFRTERALDLREQDPHRSLAMQMLSSINSEHPLGTQLVSEVSDALQRADRPHSRPRDPCLTRPKILSPERRCGRPFKDEFEEDKNVIFVPIIYNSVSSRGHDITPFFLKRNTFINFLGNYYVQV